MKFWIVILAVTRNASAYPSAFLEGVARSNSNHLPRADGNNCGPIPCLSFDPEGQLVPTTEEHAFRSPAASDIRGPCPGLNAAVNHGYLPRNGVPTLVQTTSGLSTAYGFGQDATGFLAAYAIAMEGDLITRTWSIGGPQPLGTFASPLGRPQGISYSHNEYEGDASITRFDSYLNNGDAHSVNMSRFTKTYAAGMKDNRYTMDMFRQQFGENVFDSIANNPYFFSPPFSTTAVSPVAYYFVIRLMSNHTASEPSGYLDGNIFKTFWGVSGEHPNFTWLKGQERIPDNWYRRPLSSPYSIADAVSDLATGWIEYPSHFRIGGNTAGVNTYRGVDLSLLTNGTYNDANILQGDNLGCFLFQGLQQANPEQLTGGVNDVVSALKFLNGFIDPILAQFECPQLEKYDPSVFLPYPGRTYRPTGVATNY